MIEAFAVALVGVNQQVLASIYIYIYINYKIPVRPAARPVQVKSLGQLEATILTAGLQLFPANSYFLLRALFKLRDGAGGRT